MPIIDGMYFATDEDYRKYLETMKIAEEGKLPTLTERIEEYLREAKPPEEETKLTWTEKVGLAVWNKVSDFFVIMWKSVFTILRANIREVLLAGLGWLGEITLVPPVPTVPQWIESMISSSPLPQKAKADLINRVRVSKGVEYLLLILYIITSNLGQIVGYTSGGMEIARQESNKQLQPSLPGLGDIFTARFRDPKYAATIDDFMSRMGYSADVREMLKLVSWTLLNPEQIKELYLRAEISKDERDKRLLSLGMKSDDLELIEKLYYFIPSPNDLVRMAVREAWDETFARKWGTDLDFPDEFLEWAKKSGLSEFWTKKFWRAHWELPGAAQGFEMLHRGVISWDDLKGLLKALDVMPGWREKLLAISYAPYTRVDVRRMYGAGVIKKEDVFRTYKELGYDDIHAQNLTTFTVKERIAETKDLTKSEILGLYERKIIKRENAFSMIVELGYDKDEAEIFLTKVDYDIFKKNKEKELALVKKNYVASLISYDDARNRLSKLNLVGEELTELFRDWDIELSGKMVSLTFTQLQALLVQKIIDERTFTNELSMAGYSTKQIGWLLELTKKKVVQG